MTKDEMQRYLNQQAEDGRSEEEALHRLMEVLGLNYPSRHKKKETDSPTTD